MRFIVVFTIFLFACGALTIFADHLFNLKWGTLEFVKGLAPKPASMPSPDKIHPQEVTQPTVVDEPIVDPTLEKIQATAPAVRIEGKWYAYNPRNLYVVNGVTTYYDPGRKKQKESDHTPENVKPGQALETVDRMATKAPLAVYSPQGVKATMDGAKDAARMAEERNKVLDHLSREADRPQAGE